MRELFIVCCNGIRYGIWKEAIQSVRGIDALHRIPLSPACIAGILIDDGRTVTVADLSACIGDRHSPGIAPATRQGSILLMKQGGEVTGFAISGGIDTLPVPAAALLPLPDFLKTPVFDSCAVDDGVPIPVINVAELYRRAMRSGGKTSPGAPRITVPAPRDISEKPGIRIFSAGAELFAASAAGIASEAVRPAAVTPLPDMPAHVKGVTFVEGRLLPVIDLPQRINGQGAAPDATMLIADIGGDAYGLLVDHDGGMLPGNEAAIRPMPAIARTAWLTQVAICAGDLVPLVDVALALSEGTLSGGAPEEEPLWQRYAPGSRFDQQFLKQDVDVVEFSLLGTRHALPKQEVGEVIAFRPCREIPAAPAIVIGVVEHDGEILPVLDLALMFGRRSLATPAWRMMRVNNGDFRALVITDAVFSERRLPLAIHRAVPLKLPHHLMYGCYPDADAVRLILNVAAIALHFGESLIQQFLPALSPEMRMRSAAAQPLRDEPAVAIPVTEPEPPAVQQETELQPEPVSVRQVDELLPEPQPQAAQEAAEAVDVQQEFGMAAAIAPEAEPVDVEFVMASSPGTVMAAQESLSSADEWREQGNDLFADELPTKSPEESPEEFVAREPAASRTPDQESRGSGHLRAQQHHIAAASDASVTPEPPRAAATAGSGAPIYQQQRRSGAAKRRTAYAAVALLLLVVTLYFLGAADRPETGRPAAMTGAAGPVEAGPAKTGQHQAAAVPQPVQTGSAATKSAPAISAPAQPEPARAQPGPAHPVERPAASATAKSPVPSKPAGKDVYVVKPGDTLWDISKHYTGDPYNYPRIGGENSISDYDLIFPGQRINLNK